MVVCFLGVFFFWGGGQKHKKLFHKFTDPQDDADNISRMVWSTSNYIHVCKYYVYNYMIFIESTNV